MRHRVKDQFGHPVVGVGRESHSLRAVEIAKRAGETFNSRQLELILIKREAQIIHALLDERTRAGNQLIFSSTSGSHEPTEIGSIDIT